jgi:hypothetical protein
MLVTTLYFNFCEQCYISSQGKVISYVLSETKVLYFQSAVESNVGGGSGSPE